MRTINNAAYSDAQATNESSRSVRTFKDLDLYFTRKLSTSDVNKVTDVLAIKRAVKNLVMLNHFEKPFHPELGSGVRGLLFENLTPLTGVILSQKIQEVIEDYEPRVTLTSVDVTPDYAGNAFNVNINFIINNFEREEQSLDILLERLR